MYPIPQSEKLAQTRVCKQCSTDFPITDKDLEFYEKVSPVFNGIKCAIPAPTLCPDCRNRRRLSWRNERSIYKRTCDASGKNIISTYSPDKTYRVYEHSVWAGGSWDGIEYGRDFDFTKPFFEQFDALLKQVPLQSIFSINCENSDYSQLVNGKNCYLTFVGGNVENTMYSHWMVGARDSMDCLRCKDVDYCYDSIHCYEWCRSLIACYNCKSSNDCAFCSDLIGCSNCFMSSNLTNKQYVFRNRKLSKEAYERALEEERIENSYTKLKDEWRENMRWSIHRGDQNLNSQNCTGDFIRNSKNLSNCYEVSETENCKNFFDNGGNCANCYDATYGWKSENCYETLGADGTNNIFQIFNIVGTHRSIYSYCCNNCTDIFGCACLNHKQYCILNKQYTKEEYESLVPRIIEHMKSTGEWGEFFPSSISPFGYNESAAQDHYPLSKAQAVAFGCNWSDYEPPFPKVEKTIPASKLPESIREIPDDILNWAIECEVTGKPFRIIKQELEFYRKHGLPIPRRHPDQRHADRVALRNPRKLFERACDKCDTPMITTYAPDRKEIVYCEECYGKEVV